MTEQKNKKWENKKENQEKKIVKNVYFFYTYLIKLLFFYKYHVNNRNLYSYIFGTGKRKKKKEVLFPSTDKKIFFYTLVFI